MAVPEASRVWVAVGCCAVCLAIFLLLAFGAVAAFSSQVLVTMFTANTPFVANVIIDFSRVFAGHMQSLAPLRAGVEVYLTGPLSSSFQPCAFHFHLALVHFGLFYTFTDTQAYWQLLCW